MRLKWVSAPRRPPWPLWAVIIVAVWAVLVAVVIAMQAHTGQVFYLCLFKRMTGLPCPGCGAARGAWALLHGEVFAAWNYNPLLFTLLGIWVILLAIRLVFARTIRPEVTPNHRHLALALFMLLVLANWVYLIATGV